jgi:hypothetical protein
VRPKFMRARRTCARSFCTSCLISTRCRIAVRSTTGGVFVSGDSTIQCLLFPGIFCKPVVAQFDQ